MRSSALAAAEVLAAGENGSRRPQAAGRCHVVGAGLAGLSAAIRLALAGIDVALYEGAGQAGGRCRSFFDSRLQTTIDNGNHLVLSGNHAALSFLEAVGSRGELCGPDRPVFPFFDLASGKRWGVRPNFGTLPWWVLVPERRIPGTSALDYLGGVRLALAGPQRSVADVVPASGAMRERFWDPFTIAVMNAPAEAASAGLLWRVIRETFLRGGASCIPLFARRGLGAAFIDPALDRIRALGGAVSFNRRLLRLEANDGAITRLVFRGGEVAVGEAEAVVLAVSPAQLAALLPDIAVAGQQGVIVNAHFVLAEPPTPMPQPPFLGILNGASQWLFVRDSLVSVTISAAGALGLDDVPEDAMLERLWREVRLSLGLAGSARFAAGRIIREKRATFDQSPSAARLRPGVDTRFRNLYLAGDVTDTGLPATIEGAIRSGETAAGRAIKSLRSA